MDRVARSSHSHYVVSLNAVKDLCICLLLCLSFSATKKADRHYSGFFLFRAFTLNQIGLPINPKLSRI